MTKKAPSPETRGLFAFGGLARIRTWVLHVFGRQAFGWSAAIWAVMSALSASSSVLYATITA